MLRRVGLTELGRLPTASLRLTVALETERQSPDCSALEIWSS